jgi:hypothetical protein
MNGSYILADTPEERLAIAVVSANELYFRLHPMGVLPGYGFYEDFLAPFLTREILNAQLEQLHSGAADKAAVERELAKKIMEANALIEKRLHLEHL